MSDPDRADEQLNDVLEQIRGERPDPAFERQAIDRAWERLSRELAAQTADRADARRISSCADFQAMLSDHLTGRLTGPRRLLLEDHLGECIACRRELGRRRPGAARTDAARPEARARVASWGWRLAAAAAVFIAFVGFSFKTDVFSVESGGFVRIESLEGDLFRVTDDGAVPLAVGDELTLDAGEELRTAKGASAMLSLADDSRVELRERSQLAVLERSHWFPGRRPDGLLDLDRGSIIVEASDQGSGHLFVDTTDCEVAVQGTVFSVTSGMKGSRVSVVEGEVHVRWAGNQNVLLPGDQTTTRPSLRPVPVEHDIAWSRNSERYVELLREMRALGRELDDVLQPGLRYETDLLDVMPAGTVVYFAMPNISDELARAYRLLQDRMATSVVLREWWQEQILSSGDGHQIETILDKVRDYGDNLGDEIIMTLQIDATGEVEGPLFLARLTNAEAFRGMLADEIATLEAASDEPIPMRLLDEQATALAPGGAPEGDALLFWTHGDLLAVTPHRSNLHAVELALAPAADATIAGGAFHARLADQYRRGVEWIVGVDIDRLMHVEGMDLHELDQLGLLDIQHFIGERQQRDDRTENRAVLTFGQPRRRLAAWLAEPAALGALDYVSPDANLAAGFVMKDMRVIVDELLEMLAANDAGLAETLAAFERREGIDVRRDIAGPLGGEMVVALDGPVLPVPSWKVILEVYDPARFQRTLEWLVEALARETNGRVRLGLTREMSGDRESFRLEGPGGTFAMHYLFDGGYLIAGPSRALLDRAVQNRVAGIRLSDSRAFVDLLPSDAEVDFSGLVYQNMSPILDPLSGTLETVGGLPDAQQQFIRALAAEAHPSLALLYGRPDRIVLTSAAEGGLFSSLFSQLSGASSLLGMQQSLARVVEGQSQATH
jgi:hypothetical protein